MHAGFTPKPSDGLHSFSSFDKALNIFTDSIEIPAKD
jgi:hypothetical protein